MPPTPHLLVVDDDRSTRQLLAKFLGDHGFRVTQAVDVKTAHKAVAGARLDLIILDLMLPGEDGLSFFRALRARKNNTPVLILTAMAEETDRIVGLELGADDYVTKPFNQRELLARIRAVLRRMSAVGSAAASADVAEYRFDGWRLLPQRRELVAPTGAGVPLSAGEFDLLLAFVQHPQRVLSRDQLLDLARGRAAGLFDRSIDIQVSRLRRKLDLDPDRSSMIRTVRNGGYVFTVPVGIVAVAPDP